MIQTGRMTSDVMSLPMYSRKLPNALARSCRNKNPTAGKMLKEVVEVLRPKRCNLAVAGHTAALQGISLHRMMPLQMRRCAC
jgi:hypothetical protein